jgi:anti-sigma B factor antagonist
MEISSTQYKHCDLVKVHGRVDSSTGPQLEEVLNTVFSTNRFHIIIDLSNVEFMASAGLRVLINGQKKCKRFNRGEIVLASVPQNIYGALDLAGFIPLFKIYKDITTAVGSF